MHMASRHRNLKLMENPPEPSTDSIESLSPADQVKIDWRATELSAAELEKCITCYFVEDILLISPVAWIIQTHRRKKISTKNSVKLL